MELTQADYDERKQRQNDGIASDEDRRLIKLYESQGFEQSRLIRERAAKQATHGTPPGTAETTAERITPPDPDAKRDEWVAFARKVNERLAPDERPVADPGRAQKQELVNSYRGYVPPAQAGDGDDNDGD